MLPRGFEPVELEEDDADGAAVFINTETNTVIRVYGASKAPASETTATTRPAASNSTATTSAPSAGSTTTVAAAGAATDSTTTIATSGQQTSSTTSAPAGGATETTTAAPTTQSSLSSTTATTELVPMYNDDNSNIAATDFATQQVSAPIEGEGDNVIVTSTVDVGTHIVVIEVEGPPETVAETLEETSNGLVLRDPDPSEVRLSDSISLAIPGGFSATGSSNGWLQYASADQTLTIIGGVAGSGNASRSGTLAMIDQYGNETGATANYSIWSAVEADGRAVGEIVVSAPGSSFSISVDGPTTSGVNNRLSAVRNRLIVTDLAAS